MAQAVCAREPAARLTARRAAGADAAASQRMRSDVAKGETVASNIIASLEVIRTSKLCGVESACLRFPPAHAGRRPPVCKRSPGEWCTIRASVLERLQEPRLHQGVLFRGSHTPPPPVAGGGELRKTLSIFIKRTLGGKLKKDMASVRRLQLHRKGRQGFRDILLARCQGGN